uniref:SLCO5A1 protein n=1 Tax=Homo sapiens TaxID=9606 RepID=Q6PJF4_HUMAN|nr:SLCO5A1 protein [Homo sapiens]
MPGLDLAQLSAPRENSTKRLACKKGSSAQHRPTRGPSQKQ